MNFDKQRSLTIIFMSEVSLNNDNHKLYYDVHSKEVSFIKTEMLCFIQA